MSKEEKLEVLRRVVADQSIYDIVCALRGPDFFADSLKFLFTARIRDLANVRLGVRRHSRQVDFETIEVAYKESHYALERGADVWHYLSHCYHALNSLKSMVEGEVREELMELEQLCFDFIRLLNMRAELDLAVSHLRELYNSFKVIKNEDTADKEAE